MCPFPRRFSISSLPLCAFASPLHIQSILTIRTSTIISTTHEPNLNNVNVDSLVNNSLSLDILNHHEVGEDDLLSSLGLDMDSFGHRDQNPVLAIRRRQRLEMVAMGWLHCAWLTFGLSQQPCNRLLCPGSI